ncbi:MAG: hypothetical protein ACYSUK_00165 [Planctomycetota bacterium]
MQDEVDRLEAQLTLAELKVVGLRDEIERLTKECNSRLCSSCLEQHDVSVMCPPHEVRTTGQEWFRQKLRQQQQENERLRGALRKIGDQALSAELGPDEEDADYCGAYDCLISLAREALEKSDE